MYAKQYRITIRDIAEATGQSEDTVRKHRKEGRLVTTPVGISEYIAGNRLLRKGKASSEQGK